jgi:predicted amidophosphoribosyltransferase
MPTADRPPARPAAPSAARDLLARARDHLVAALAPPACAACRAPLTGAHAVLCAHCRAQLPWLTDPRCPHCGLPRPCGTPCPAQGAAYAAAWAPLAHDGPARRLVATLKFGGALPVADLMAAQIAATAPRGLLAPVPAVSAAPTVSAKPPALVPVPLHPARRRARGFDQSERIAAALARRTGLPLAPCLRRDGAPTRQLGASRTARLRAAGRLRIAVVDAPPRTAILVDDVHTTGATFEACARALRAAGCGHVMALAYARALP